MRRAGRKKKPLTIQPIKCVVMLSSDEENDCIAAEKKENKQLKRIMEFADNNNLIPMKVFRRGIFGRRLSDEVFYRTIRYMRAGRCTYCSKSRCYFRRNSRFLFKNWSGKGSWV